LTRWLVLALVTFTAVSASAAGKKTHLGVPPNQIVNLSTFELPPDGTAGTFFFDRVSLGTDGVTVPEGFSFVVTDVLVHPADFNDPSAVYLAVLSASADGRSITFQLAGTALHHFALAGAFVIASGATPQVRNTSSSTGPLEVQLLGYFVKAEALRRGDSPFPE
jgi:hypothetical protein